MCACSFSAQHFPSIVDRWLESRVNASASPPCLPLSNRLLRRLSATPSCLPFYNDLAPLQSNHLSPTTTTTTTWPSPSKGAPATSPRHKDNDGTRQWSPPNVLRYLTVTMHSVVAAAVIIRANQGEQPHPSLFAYGITQHPHHIQLLLSVPTKVSNLTPLSFQIHHSHSSRHPLIDRLNV